MADPSPANPASDGITRAFMLAVPLFLLGLVLARLGAFGIWDPSELSAADAARRWTEGEGVAPGQAPLPSWLIGLGFLTFGASEWAGRVPMALAGLAALAMGGHWVRSHTDVRTGLYAMLIAGTTPLVLFESRQMLGEAPLLASSTLVILSASSAVYGPARFRYAWLGATAAAVVLAVLARGALLGVLPPLLAVTAAGGLLPPEPGSARKNWLALSVLAAALTALVVRDVWADTATYSAWVGGAPLGDAPDTYDKGIESIFHGFAPWSGLLPVALGSLFLVRDDAQHPDTPEGPNTRTALQLQMVLWAGLAYAAMTLYASRYGHAGFGAPVALGAAVALWLRDVERRDAAWWPAATVALLFTALLIRDFAMYPGSPIDGLNTGDVEVPKAFNPRRWWASLLGACCVGIALMAAAGGGERKLNLQAPYKGLRELWGRGWTYRAWLVAVALLLLGLGGVGVFAMTPFAQDRMGRLAIRVTRYFVGVFLLPVVVGAGQGVWWLSAKLHRGRTLPLLVFGALTGLYAAHGFLPKLSDHFSPREVYEVYNRLAAQGEPLAQHRVAGRSATYYAKGKVEDMKQRTELVRWLSQPGRRWTVFPSEDLGDIDVAFRRRTKRHLFIPSRTNARVTLAASEAVKGSTDQNPLTAAVLNELPKPVQHKVGATFETKIELLGYDVELPGGDHVGQGEKFTVTWAFKALKRNIGQYKIFLHVDGPGKRIHGDHEPVDGKYPVRLWDKGDIVLDRQEISVPSSATAGTYTLYLGFYRGNSRLKVVEGKKDNANRVRAGTIRIR